MNENRDYVCYDLLLKVFRDNAYGGLELNAALSKCAAADRPYVTKLFYGVLERSVYYDYVLEKFAKEKPKKPVAIIIKMGYYRLEKMNEPAYAVVDTMVELCKKVGKGGAAGFVNSLLRKFIAPPLPPEGTVRYLSVRYSYPMWLCSRLCADYGYDFVRAMLEYETETRTHIRVNTAAISEEEFRKKYCEGRLAEGKNSDDKITPSPVGYYVPRKLLENIPQTDYVVQSAASIAAATAYTYGLTKVDEALDLCAAPGGKAVLVAQNTGARVTACDVHPHRVEFIRQYAERCKVNVTATVNDASAFRPEWKEKFDLVVCDVPCSGIGVAGAKPDILFNRTEKDIAGIVSLQKEILYTASKYVKKGGRLCYSTCTILKEENGEVAREFLAKHPEFTRTPICSPFTPSPQEDISLFPHVNGTEGFYVVAFTKTE